MKSKDSSLKPPHVALETTDRLVIFASIWQWSIFTFDTSKTKPHEWNVHFYVLYIVSGNQGHLHDAYDNIFVKNYDWRQMKTQ